MTPTDTIDFEIGGMTCAACAARIERTLNNVDGVDATVNYALEVAHVEAPSGTDPAALVGVIEAAGYSARLRTPGPRGAPDTTTALGWRVAIVAVLAVPVIVMGMVPAWQFTGWQWVSLALTTPIATWGAWPFHRVALANLRHRSTTMDTLVSLGVGIAYLWSLGALLFGDAGAAGMRHDFTLTADRMDATSAIYFEVAAATTLFLLLGRWFEARARRRGGDAIRALADLGAKEASRLGPDGRETLVPVDVLARGDRFVVRPGEKIATDGVVVDGRSAIDASLVTGESVPTEVGPGDQVTGATVNVAGRLVVEATRVGADTTLAQMARLVADAQSGKAPVQRLADRVAAVFVPIVLLLSAATFLAWLALGESAAAALAPAIAVLIVACPCALGLATPLALLAGTGRGAQLGVLIRGPDVLESARAVDTIVVDKTGTVTTGRMGVVEIVAANGLDRHDLLVTMASIESASEHPVAKAIAAAIAPEERRPVEDFRSASGLGVEGTVGGRRVRAGRPSFVAEGRAGDDGIDEALRRAAAGGRTVVAIGWDGRITGVAVVADTVRPTSAAAVAAFGRLGLTTVLLTGDNAAAAATVAAEVGISTVLADVEPAGKLDAVRRLQADGHVVAMVGDGVNDAAALVGADLGLAMGGGTDASIEAADITLVRDDLGAAVDAVGLSRRTLRTIKVNLAWAFGYNVAALPLAALGLLNPMVAGLAMASSSVLVVANSLRLFRFQPSGR